MLTRREMIETAYKSGVRDVLEVLIEIKPDPEHWQELIKETGKTFGVDVYTLNELIDSVPDEY